MDFAGEETVARNAQREPETIRLSRSRCSALPSCKHQIDPVVLSALCSGKDLLIASDRYRTTFSE